MRRTAKIHALLEQELVHHIKDYPCNVRDADIPKPYDIEFQHSMYGSAMLVIEDEVAY